MNRASIRKVSRLVIHVGDAVSVLVAGRRRRGVVRYAGDGASLGQGVWLGIELVKPAGLNDGSVNGVRYFHCPAGCGVFVRPTAVLEVVHARRRERPPARVESYSYSYTYEDDGESCAPDAAKTCSSAERAPVTPADIAAALVDSVGRSVDLKLAALAADEARRDALAVLRGQQEEALAEVERLRRVNEQQAAELANLRERLPVSASWSYSTSGDACERCTDACLVSVEDAALELAQGARAFDCRFDVLGDPQRGARDYLAGHLPGAIYVRI